jgi:hypothetical protein
MWMDLGAICGFRFCVLLKLMDSWREEECWLLGLRFSDKILKFKKNVVVIHPSG